VPFATAMHARASQVSQVRARARARVRVRVRVRLG
jgi:hypothetical protein